MKRQEGVDEVVYRRARHHKGSEHHFEVKEAFNSGLALFLDFASEAITFMAAGLL